MTPSVFRVACDGNTLNRIMGAEQAPWSTAAAKEKSSFAGVLRRRRRTSAIMLLNAFLAKVLM